MIILKCFLVMTANKETLRIGDITSQVSTEFKGQSVLIKYNFKLWQ